MRILMPTQRWVKGIPVEFLVIGTTAYLRLNNTDDEPDLYVNLATALAVEPVTPEELKFMDRPRIRLMHFEPDIEETVEAAMESAPVGTVARLDDLGEPL